MTTAVEEGHAIKRANGEEFRETGIPTGINTIPQTPKDQPPLSVTVETVQLAADYQAHPPKAGSNRAESVVIDYLSQQGTLPGKDMLKTYATRLSAAVEGINKIATKAGDSIISSPNETEALHIMGLIGDIGRAIKNDAPHQVKTALSIMESRLNEGLGTALSQRVNEGSIMGGRY